MAVIQHKPHKPPLQNQNTMETTFTNYTSQDISFNSTAVCIQEVLKSGPIVTK